MKRVLLGAALAVMTATSAFAADIAAKVAVHLDDNDPARMNLVLNNVANIQKYYADKGEVADIEVVAYGPGLHMLRADTSPVAERIAAMAGEHVTFSACQNTMAGMARKEGHPIELLVDATPTPSGAIRLIELQQQGYAYLRP